MPVKQLAFASAYFSESGLFNGLQPIQIKKILRSSTRAPSCVRRAQPRTAPPPPGTRPKRGLISTIGNECRRCFWFCQAIASPGTNDLVDFRVGGRRPMLEKIEVAPLVRLAHVLREQKPIAAAVAGRRAPPGGAAPLELLVAHLQGEAAGGNVEFDHVAVAHQGERAPDEGFGRDMQDAGAV